MVFVTHPTGNSNVKAILYQLEEANMLDSFFVFMAVFPGSVQHKLAAFFPSLNRRIFDRKVNKFTKTYPDLELRKILSGKIKHAYFSGHEHGIFSIDQLCRKLDFRVSKQVEKAMKGTIVYGYEDCCITTFQAAKAKGLPCVYDLPIAYWEFGHQLLKEEAVRMPAWINTLGSVKDSEAKLARKTAELELADMVVVPSQFVYDSLPVWAKNKKIVLSPFGSPGSNTEAVLAKRKASDGNRTSKLRVLFVGSMGQRKGLGDLFEAMKLLNKKEVELVVLGSLLDDIDFYKSQFPDFIYEAPRAHPEVLELMSQCDIFCLPSLVEGRALVMQEAMSQGLPLIITPNTGGSDLIMEGKTGFLVPIRSPKAIAEKIQWFIENKQQLPDMAQNAILHAATYTWESYSKKVVEEIRSTFLSK